jgi:formylglycine-generating enzyme required for sulfatase activity
VVGHTLEGKSPFDVQDLARNVWEWCLDAWADSYAEIKVSPVDPCHQDDIRGGSRVVRGGSWGNDPRLLRSACRIRNLPGDRYPGVGFRVVCGGARQRDAH